MFLRTALFWLRGRIIIIESKDYLRSKLMHYRLDHLGFDLYWKTVGLLEPVK
jgi:hypothetical protein